MKSSTKFVLGIFALMGLAGLLFAITPHGPTKDMSAFATCLKDKGAVFYGAFWCPHCQNQKKLFGKAEKLLNYVECSTPDSRAQLQVCINEQVKSYPTWEFADGSRLTGEVALEKLAEKTGCTLPE